ncbi:MAG: type II CRISPR RNA-guided endonuclease Cas9, partial [Actinomycetota bacterium]
VGEWLASRHSEGEGVRARRVPAAKGPDDYALYLDRQMIDDEFNALWDAQERLSGGVGLAGGRQALYDVLFTQRPLKPVASGRCTLEPDKSRAAKALPSVQRLRIFQEANHLKVGTSHSEMRPLTVEERDLVVKELLSNKRRTFGHLRKVLRLSSTSTFNLESPKRSDLAGDMTGVLLGKDEYFGRSWTEIDLKARDEIVEKLVGTPDVNGVIADDAEVIEWLVENHGLNQERALAVVELGLPPGYSNLCLDATSLVLAELELAVIAYSEAVESAGYSSHSALLANQETGELLFKLPYYGEVLERHVGFGSGKLDDSPEKRYGKIANPTVHIALNEVRKVVNELIGEYGTPAQVVVEVARELKHSAKVKEEIEKSQKANQVRNEYFAVQLAPVLSSEPSNNDLRMMRLWSELNENCAARCCPYTGEQISIERMFGAGADIEIEHILPLSRTLDDSLANKTLAVRRANRDKGDSTPYEAFGDSPGEYNYEEILIRVQSMPKKKAWRFEKDALERFLREDTDFTARALND